MKKLIVVAIVAIFLTMSSLTASADFSRAEKNVGRTLICPFKAVGAVVTDVFKSLTLQKSTAILAIPKHVRQQTTDMLESAGRTIVGAEPIADDGNGAATTWIADNNLDPLVDFFVYGVTAGVWTHNKSNLALHHNHLGLKVLGWTGGGVVAADLIDQAVEK
ncbi:MAG: hypothetical protein WC517_00105 [Patescibacteria group bacterium]